jgi:alkanesulfonate monooxygenase SsuD/methylene tetrahydromethanopterin reductase-like flavin-dependent oxidoreductase (luciferase family)
MKTILLLDAIHDASTPPAQQLAEHCELLETAVQLGIDGIVCGQHFLGSEMRYYQPVPYLAHLSTLAPTLRIVLGIVLLPLLNPVQVAEDVATLDVVTGGRVTLGCGMGYSDRELRAFGIDRSERGARFEESLDLISRLWSGDPVTHVGRHFQVDPDTRPSVLPVQRPRPPIWIGGQTLAAVRRAARLADAWYAPPFTTHAALSELAAVCAEERDRLGRGPAPEFPVRRELLVAETKAAARRGMLERSRARHEVYLRWGLADHGGLADAGGANLDAETAEEADGRFLLGPAENCAAGLARLRDEVGMTHFVYKPQWLGLPHLEAMRQLEAYGTQVLPLLDPV